MNALRTTLAISACMTVAAASFAGSAPMPIRVGELSSTNVESPHPYPGGDGLNPVVTTVKVTHPGATYMGVHFSGFELADGDHVVVRDPDSRRDMRYSGRGLGDLGDFWSMRVPGDTALIEIHSVQPGGGHGFTVDQYEYGFADIFGDQFPTNESQCGNDDLTDVKCYETSHPLEYAKARSVARLVVGGSLCTGSLISCDNHLLTNQHCKPGGGPTATEAQFNYHNNNCGSGPTSTRVNFQGLTDVSTDATLDYWLLTLAGDPVSQFDHLTLDPRPLVFDEPIFIPQHPGGSPKKFGIDSDVDPGMICRIRDTNRAGNGPDTDAGYRCDTAGGSSGSPVLSSADQRVIVLHHFGTGAAPGFCDDVTMNGGVRIENIFPRIEAFLPPCSLCTNPPDAPTNPMVRDTGPNELTVTWDPVPGATGYRVLRAVGGCTSSLALLTEVATTTYVDTAVSVGLTYGYVIESTNDIGCRSLASTCVEMVASGNCTLTPTFTGSGDIHSSLDSVCELTLDWPTAVGSCSNDVVYNVYRSETPGFTPGPTNLLDSCWRSGPYVDVTVAPDTRYFYIVRAEDRGGVGAGACAGGVEDTNVLDRNGRATNSTLSVVGDGAEAAPIMSLEAPWSVSTVRARTGAASFRVVGDTPDTCASLTTPPVVVTSSSRLSYSVWMDNVEQTWDGGTVELSNDFGRTWTKLNPTPAYPTLWDARSTSCNIGSGGGYYSGNSSTWTDASVPLDTWAGQEVLVRFRFGTDGSVTSTAWHVDDIEIRDAAEDPCGGLISWQLYRSTVTSLPAGWARSIPLPLTPGSLIDPMWPIAFTAPGYEEDLGILLDTNPLIVYRLLDDMDRPVGNELKLVKTNGTDITVSY